MRRPADSRACGDGERHRRENDEALMPGRVYEERKEGHVEDDGLRVEQRDEHRLAEEPAGLHIEDRRGSGLRHDHADAKPAEVDGAGVLDDAE